MLQHCHGVLRLPGTSKGADQDVAIARERGIPVWHRLEDVPGEFRRLLLGQMEANAALGVEPFYGFSKAPRRFWTLYEQARALVTPTPLEEMENEEEEAPRYEARLAA